MQYSTKKLKLITWVIFIVVLLASGWLVLFRSGDNQGQESMAGENNRLMASDAHEAPVEVEAAPARTGDLVLRISATGLTRALREIAIATKIGGQVVQLPIQEGRFVRKGELLLQLDDREYRLALNEARDRLLSAQVDFIMLQREEKRGEEKSLEREATASSTLLRTDSQRDSGYVENTTRNAELAEGEDKHEPGVIDELARARKRLEAAQNDFERGEISESDFDRVKLNYETALVLSGQKREALLAHKTGLTEARIALERAELNLSYTEVSAPFSGYVADLKIEQGQYVSAGQECFKLVDLSQIEVNLQVLESEIGQAAKGRQTEITFPAYPGKTFQGRVAHINPVVDQETKTARVVVRLDNPDGLILPGMFAYAKLQTQIFKDRLLVPREAILIRDQRKLLFIVRDGLAKWCYVETGLENEEFVEILSSSFDLKPGEMVITAGHYTLAHDARVKY